VLANELDNTMDVFAIGRDGGLAPVRRLSTLPPDFRGRSFAGEVALAPDASAAFVGNRGHDSVARIPLDGAAGHTRWLPSHGRHPRHFALSPDGRRLAIVNRDDDNAVVYRLARPWGEPAGAAVLSAIPAPAFVMWL
jgi:6-phosphogluconolactonase